MRPRLLNLLRCPQCTGLLSATPFVQSPSDDEMVDGVLTCACGSSYPVVSTIPRMLKNAYELFPSFVDQYRERLASVPGVRVSEQPQEAFGRLLTRTRESFGYQWTHFSEMACDFRQNFFNYLSPATPEFFQGRLGLDAGCGFGRHIFHAASCGAEMVGVDCSRAIDSTYRNTKRLPSVYLVQADIYALPFAERTFDFVYSIGVLHHLPDPPAGVQSLAALVKRHGTLFIWVYSKRRRITNFLLERLRVVTAGLPHPVVNSLSFIGASIDQYGCIIPYRLMKRVPVIGSVVERLTPQRVKMYSAYPFQVLHADWFDRLAAPIRFYYDESEVGELMRNANLSEILVTPTGLYGWRGRGVKP